MAAKVASKQQNRLPNKYEIINPTLMLIKSITTKEDYLKYSSRKGANTNRLKRDALIKAANPPLTLKQAQNRGACVYASLQPALDAKAKEAIKNGWIDKLSKNNFPKKHDNTPKGELIKETCDLFSSQCELAEKDSQLRIRLNNELISKEEVCSINNDFQFLVKENNKNIFSCNEIVNLYWAKFTSNRRYIGLDGNNIYDSPEECLVGNYLYLSEIPFKTHVNLESCPHKPDFKLLEHNTYIEVLMCDPEDKRACSRTSERRGYTERTLNKIKIFNEIMLPVKYINGDCSTNALYELTKDLISKFYPDKVPPELESVRKFHKENLAYLLQMTEEEICQLVNKSGGTANFRNNSFAEYRFLENNYPKFSTLFKKLKREWTEGRQKRSVNSRLKNSDYMSVQEHIEAIYNSNLRRAIGLKPWLNDRQALYNAWGSHYDIYRKLFKKLQISEPPARFKLSFFKNAGPDNKNLKIAKFLYS